MTPSNFIHLTETELDSPIYRIMPIVRVLQMFESRCLVLVKPKLWNDPFENALLSARFRAPDGSIIDFAAKNSVYGQCWTVHRETDAMWRIYSPQTDGVRISTTPRRLFESLKRVDSTFWQNRCFIGKVDYHTEADLLRVFGGVRLMGPDGSGVAKSLLYKRIEFHHEQEVRVVYTGDDLNQGPDVCRFEVDPVMLIDEFTFDPRMDKALVSAYTLAINRHGVNLASISTSGLYSAPRGLEFNL